MAAWKMIESECSLRSKNVRGNVYKLEMIVFISEDINYKAEDTIDPTDESEEYREECCVNQGIVETGDNFDEVAIAIFKNRAELGEYSTS